jgi:hypothetical protein
MSPVPLSGDTLMCLLTYGSQQIATCRPNGGGMAPGSGIHRALLLSQCPLWVKSRHLQCTDPCPLYPQKRTCAVHQSMSAMGQKRTSAAQQKESSSDQLVGAGRNVGAAPCPCTSQSTHGPGYSAARFAGGNCTVLAAQANSRHLHGALH